MAAEAFRIRDQLKEFFDVDARFTFETLAGHGNHAAACRLRYTDPETGREQRFIVKRSFKGETHLQGLREEKRWLTVSNFYAQVQTIHMLERRVSEMKRKIIT